MTPPRRWSVLPYADAQPIELPYADAQPIERSLPPIGKHIRGSHKPQVRLRSRRVVIQAKDQLQRTLYLGERLGGEHSQPVE